MRKKEFWSCRKDFNSLPRTYRKEINSLLEKLLSEHRSGNAEYRLNFKDMLKIKEPYGEAVFMRYVQSLSLEEISEITGESENTISVRVHRGLSILKKLFNHES
jgi:DNA-directed RNA polymerase specialized sigma24 family protein